MRSRSKKFVLAAGIAAAGMLVGGSVTWAASGGSNDANRQPPSGRTANATTNAAPIDTSTEAKFTAITPCRIADTRVAGGALTASVTKSFQVAGTNGFGAQGGTNGGCGVPPSASAVAASVVAANETGPGYLVTWPTFGTQPFASFLNYVDSRPVSTGVTMTINYSSMNVQAGAHGADVVIDVSGYYVPPMFAHVNFSGTITTGSRTNGSNLLATGQYEVFFDRDVSACAYNATVDPLTGFTIKVQPRFGNVTGVFVRIADLANANTSEGFYLTVTC